MRQSTRVAGSSAVLTMLFLASCKTTPPAPADAGKLTPVASALLAPDAAGPEAANELNVKRYDDEKLVDHVAKTVRASSASAVTSYPKGDSVATLQNATPVTVLAERNGFSRVTFADEKSPGRRTMAWVVSAAFDEPLPPTKVPVSRCPVTMGIQVTVLQNGKATCAYECAAARECAGGGTCEAAPLLTDAGELPPSPRYTTVCTPPAGGADAGPKVPSLFGEMRLSNGKCREGFTEAPKLGALCFMTCKTDRNCAEGFSCKATPAAREKLCFGN
jgi:hypothetical protein